MRHPAGLSQGLLIIVALMPAHLSAGDDTAERNAVADYFTPPSWALSGPRDHPAARHFEFRVEEMLRYVRKRTNEFHSRYGLVDCAAATKAYFEKQKYRIGPEPDGGNSEKIAAFSNDMIKAGTAFMDFEEVSAAAGSVTAAFEEFLADARFDEASRDRFFFPRYEAELSRMAVKLGDARVRVLDRWDERALDQKFAELLEADDQIESCLEELMKGEREHAVLAHDRRVTKIRYEQQIFDLFASSLPGDQVTAQTDKLRAEEDKKLGALDKQVTDHEKTRDAVREKIKKLVEKKIDFESLMPKEVQR